LGGVKEIEITAEEVARMRESLSEIKDWRRQWGNILHKLTDVLVIGLTTILGGWDEFTVMEDFGKAKESFFRGFLELPHGIPDEKTFARVFARINPFELQAALQKWLIELNKEGERQINIDGKTARGSGGKGRRAAHIVSAWVGSQNLVLGQLKVDAKSNEIPAIPQLLDTLEVAGDTITIDAMGCQTAIAEKIRELEANYVLAVKENQPELYNGIREYFEYLGEQKCRELPQDIWKSGIEKEHGRIEEREVLTSEDIDWLSGKEKWKDLKSIIQYRCRRTENGETTVTDRYYISNLSIDADEFARIIRGHWSIENNLHWFLDVCFGEDECRARTNHAAENLNILRKIALYLLRKTSVPEKRFGTRRKMLRATLSDEFLFQTLFGKSK
jgi:predicted transposase YbfD/YdcC